MTVKIEIFSQGDEVISGQVVDSNAAWLSDQCVHMGFKVVRHSAVGDDLTEMMSLLEEIAGRANCCLCTGGLGPTVDDLTAQAVAQAFDLPLQQDNIALQQIESYFAARNRPMADVNRKQAMLPADSQRLDNAWGTAPGFSVNYQGCRFYFMPGVPYEMREMFLHVVQPQLAQRYPVKAAQLITFKTVGIGESDIQQRLQPLKLPDNVQLGFRANPEEVQTKLLFPAEYHPAHKTILLDQVRQLLGDYVFAVDDGSSSATDLVSVIDQLMRQQKLTLTVLETVSHGMLAAKCLTRIWLKTSLCCQTMAELSRQLNISTHSSDYEMCLQTIAKALKSREQTDMVLLQLYNGGESALKDEDKMITLYTGLLTADGFSFNTRTIAGPMTRKQNQSAILALDHLRRFLQHKH